MQHRKQFDERVVETSDVKASSAMKGISGNTSGIHESHRHGRGLSFSPGTSSAADSRTRAVGRPGTRDDCPEFRQLSETSAFFLVLFASFSMTYKRQSNCTVSCARLQRRPDVKNPKRSERTSRPENQWSIGSREFSRIEEANPIRGSRPADSLGFARSNAGGSRGRQVFGAMRF